MKANTRANGHIKAAFTRRGEETDVFNFTSKVCLQAGALTSGFADAFKIR
jgi:hypothetical protein